MMNVVPADWKFRFMGSEESVAFVNGSRAIRWQVERGKLDLSLYVLQCIHLHGREIDSRKGEKDEGVLMRYVVYPPT